MSGSGGSELAGVPGQRGADPWRQERGAGHGVRWRAGVEPVGPGSGGAAVHGPRGEAGHRVPGGEVVKRPGWLQRREFWLPDGAHDTRLRCTPV